MFLADNEAWKHVTQTAAKQADGLGCKIFLNTGVRARNLLSPGRTEKNSISSIIFVVKNIYEYYAKWIREGKLKVNSDWNKDLKIKFTVQDPCQIVSKRFW